MLSLIRLHSCLAGALTNFAALRLLDSDLLLPPLAVFLMVGGVNTLNDVFDAEIDRTNAPHRPIPSGTVSAKQALALAVILFIAGAAVSWRVGPRAGLFALLQISVLVAYCRWSKRMGLFKNPFFAAYCASVVVFAGIAEFRVNGFLVVMTACCFSMMMAMEIIKDIPDLEGDGAAGALTLPIVIGPQSAVRVAIAMGVITWGLALLPYFLGWVDVRSAVMTTLGLLIGLFPFRHSPPPLMAKGYILAGTMTGLAGFFIGR